MICDLHTESNRRIDEAFRQELLALLEDDTAEVLLEKTKYQQIAYRRIIQLTCFDLRREDKDNE